MSEITWAELTEDQQKALKEYESGLCSDITRQNWWFLRDNGLITAEELTFVGRVVLAQADSAKPPVIDAATFANEHYDSKIANGECIVRDGYGDIVRNVKLTICIMSGTYRVTEQDGCDYLMHRSSSANKFTVTWLAQADSAKPEGDAWGKPSRVRETDIEALESDLNDAIETHQRDIVRIATLSTEIDTLQTDLATAREQVARINLANNMVGNMIFNLKQVGGMDAIVRGLESIAAALKS